MKAEIRTQFAIRVDHHTFSISCQPDGRIVRPEKGLASRIKVGDLIAVRCKGFYTDFGSMGIKSYCPAEYQIWQIEDIEEKGLLLIGTAGLLLDFPVKN